LLSLFEDVAKQNQPQKKCIFLSSIAFFGASNLAFLGIWCIGQTIWYQLALAMEACCLDYSGQSLSWVGYGSVGTASGIYEHPDAWVNMEDQRWGRMHWKASGPVTNCRRFITSFGQRGCRYQICQISMGKQRPKAFGQVQVVAFPWIR
jgi:hypothetical protein